MNYTASLRLISQFLLSSLALSCASPATSITSTWKDPQAKSYKDFFVAVLLKNEKARQALEGDITHKLKSSKVKAMRSLEVFPHTERPETNEERQAAVEKIHGLGNDAILVVVLKNKTEEEAYTPGKTQYAPTTIGYGTGYGNTENMNNVGSGSYGAFGVYYVDNYQLASTPGHYNTINTYTVESNLYDAATGKLLWTIKSDTFNPANLAQASSDFSDVLVESLEKNKLVFGK